MNKNRLKTKKHSFINKLCRVVKSEKYAEYIFTHADYAERLQASKNIHIWSVQFFDVIDNFGMNRLCRKISKLPKKDYEIKLYYRASRWKILNYFQLQYTSSGSSLIGSIEFINDNYIKKVDLSFSQINNNQAIVEYKLSFNKIVEYNHQIKFISENKSLYVNSPFTTYYDESVLVYKDYNQIDHMLCNAFIETLQSKLLSITFLGIGEDYPLPSITIKNYPKGMFNKEDFQNIFLGASIETNVENQYIVYDYTNDYGLGMDLYFSGSTYHPITFTNLIQVLRMDFYYFLFDRIEQAELNKRMNKYFGKPNQKISSHDYKWIVNKVRAVHDNKLHVMNENKNIGELRSWQQFRNGVEVDFDFLKYNSTEKYEVIYTECLNHIKTLYGLQKENFIITIATITLVVSIIGVVVTVIMASG